MNLDELKALCALCGTSGREHEVRAYILEELSKLGLPADAVRVDRLGNVLVHKKGRSTAKNRVLFSAHMDEVALMVTDINADGTLAFGAVGGIHAAALIGRQVMVGEEKICGVIGAMPVHHLSADARKTPVEISALYCDIGSADKGETAQLVRPGDIIYFDTEPREFGHGSFAAKAIDDRFGCAVLLSLLREDLPYDMDFSFVVQEEVGLRGAGVAASAVQPDIAVIFEATTAADLPDASGAERVCELSGGAVISLIDGHTIYDKALYDLAVSLCEKEGIPCQTKRKVAGGNDAGAIQNAGSGVRVMAVSVPCRYLHAPVSVLRMCDADACADLAKLLCAALPEAAV